MLDGWQESIVTHIPSTISLQISLSLTQLGNSISELQWTSCCSLRVANADCIKVWCSTMLESIGCNVSCIAWTRGVANAKHGSTIPCTLDNKIFQQYIM